MTPFAGNSYTAESARWDFATDGTVKLWFKDGDSYVPKKTCSYSYDADGRQVYLVTKEVYYVATDGTVTAYDSAESYWNGMLEDMGTDIGDGVKAVYRIWFTVPFTQLATLAWEATETGYTVTPVYTSLKNTGLELFWNRWEDCFLVRDDDGVFGICGFAIDDERGSSHFEVITASTDDTLTIQKMNDEGTLDDPETATYSIDTTVSPPTMALSLRGTDYHLTYTADTTTLTRVTD